MDDDFSPLLLSSQDRILSDATFQNIWDNVQNITQQGSLTRILEREPAVTFSELGTDNTIDFECERFSFLNADELELFNPSQVPANVRTQQNENSALQPIESNINLNDYSLISSELPANNNWPGNFNFQISFDTSQEKKTKGAAWTYSELLDKLFVNVASACPLQIHTNDQQIGATIRVTPVFIRAADAATVVKRCYEHSLPTDASNYNFPFPEHLIRIENSKAEYCTDPISGRLSVTVPLESLQAGVDFSPYIIKFMCLGSCGGSLSRRPLQVIFTLELGGQCLGRRTLQTKICKCPGRDKTTEEKNYTKKTNNSNITKFTRTTSQEFISLQPIAKRTRFEEPVEEPQQEYTITVKKRELYEMLLKIKESFELAETVAPEVAKEYREKNSQKVVQEAIPAETKSTKNSASPSKSSDEQPLRKIISIPTFTEDIDKQESDQSILGWLTTLNMEAYFDAFLEEGIRDFSQLSDTTQETLARMKIGKGHQKILLDSIQKLSYSATSSKGFSLSQGSQHSVFTCSQDSTTSNSRGFTITRYKISHHTSVAGDHDYI